LHGVFYLVKMSEKRNFTGVFIPAHIWLSPELIPAEKMLLGEIESLSSNYGYCDASRKHFAEWLQCTVQNITYYLVKLEKKGFIEIEKTPGFRSKIKLIKERFYIQAVVSGTDGGGKSGLRVVVSGTDGGGKRGLPEIQDKYKIKYNFKENEKVAEAEQFPEVGNMILALEEKEKKNTPVPAAPSFLPAPANPALDQMEWLHEMDTDPRVAETMKMAHQVPASKKDEYLAAFTVQLSGTTQVHHSRKDLRNHFFNFCRARYRAEQKEKSETTPPGQSAYTAPVTKREVPAYVD
jgi:hypothetical protein